MIYSDCMSRVITPLDRLIAGADQALRTVFSGAPRPARPNPSSPMPETVHGEADRRHVAGLMRVNHAGEIAAQGLYQGQAATARLDEVRQSMEQAAEEENDHLAWCEERLSELGSRPSVLNPLWYAGSFAIGAIAGWLAGVLMKGGGFGLLGDIVVGIIGAFIGGFLFGLLGISAGGIIGSLITATVGAAVLLWIVGMIKKA